jgi:rare lipoprotein A
MNRLRGPTGRPGCTAATCLMMVLCAVPRISAAQEMAAGAAEPGSAEASAQSQAPPAAAAPPGAGPQTDAASARYGLWSSDADDPGPESGPLARARRPEIFQRGGASWYGTPFHGRRTASGERFDMTALTAAHRTLPFNTHVCVRSLLNGREVLVRINDRGPFGPGRVIDLSRAAAGVIGMLGLGIKQVALRLPDADHPVCGP